MTRMRQSRSGRRWLFLATASLFAAAVVWATGCGAGSTSEAIPQVSASTQAAADESSLGTEDDALIAFTKGASGDACDSEGIFCAKLDGSGLRRLADKGARHAAWSPDGSQIAYTQGGDIYIVNVDGSERQLIVSGEADAWSRMAWSPDGTQIVFVNWHDDGSTLMIVNVGDGSTRQLTVFSKDRSDECPAWSPDGRIYFTRQPYGKHRKICSVNPDGSELAVVRARSWSTFSLSPDGQWLACSERGDLVRLPVDGRGAEVVLLEDVFRLGVKGLTPSSSWSPDGKQIVIGSYERPWAYQAWLYRVMADGSNLLVGPDVGLAFDPAWQPR